MSDYSGSLNDEICRLLVIHSTGIKVNNLYSALSDISKQDFYWAFDRLTAENKVVIALVGGEAFVKLTEEAFWMERGRLWERWDRECD